ncbi:MAG: hypothetical protein ACRDA5_14595, partial [Clostridium sp.]
MADLNGNTNFATTGLLKDFIAWLDFSRQVDLSISGPLTVQNIIPGGYTIDFTISAKPYENGLSSV